VSLSGAARLPTRRFGQRQPCAWRIVFPGRRLGGTFAHTTWHGAETPMSPGDWKVEMKKVECIIQAYNLDAVAEALAVEGVRGMTVTESKGFGAQRGFTRGEPVAPGQFRFHPKMKVEMVVLDEDVERVVGKIREALKSGQIGQGKIFITAVDDAVRTRTGERGRTAIE